MYLVRVWLCWCWSRRRDVGRAVHVRTLRTYYVVVDLICFLFLDQLDTNADEDGCVEENKSS